MKHKKSKPSKAKGAMEPIKWPLGTILEVHWEDSNTYGHWAGLKEVSEDHHVAQCKSVGYLLRQDKKEILLVDTQCPQNKGDGTGFMAIPRGCVRGIRKL